MNHVLMEQRESTLLLMTFLLASSFLMKALETQNPETARHMLVELLQTVKLSENLSWPNARGDVAVAMHHIEDESIAWGDSGFLAENRLT